MDYCLDQENNKHNVPEYFELCEWNVGVTLTVLIDCCIYGDVSYTQKNCRIEADVVSPHEVTALVLYFVLYLIRIHLFYCH